MHRPTTRKDDGHRDAGSGVILLICSVVLLVLPLFLSTPAAADGGAFGDGAGFAAGLGGDQDLEIGGASPLAIIGRFVFAIALVASLIVLSVMALRRYGLPRGALGVAGPRLELRAQLHLGPRRTIYLVRVDGSEILLGTAGDGLRLLTELPGAWTLASATREEDTTLAGGRSTGRDRSPFAATLGTLIRGARGPNGRPQGLGA